MRFWAGRLEGAGCRSWHARGCPNSSVLHQTCQKRGSATVLARQEQGRDRNRRLQTPLRCSRGRECRTGPRAGQSGHSPVRPEERAARAGAGAVPGPWDCGFVWLLPRSPTLRLPCVRVAGGAWFVAGE